MKLVHEYLVVFVFGVELDCLCAGNPEGFVTHDL